MGNTLLWCVCVGGETSERSDLFIAEQLWKYLCDETPTDEKVKRSGTIGALQWSAPVGAERSGRAL